jgi:hypothetical protein
MRVGALDQLETRSIQAARMMLEPTHPVGPHPPREPDVAPAAGWLADSLQTGGGGLEQANRFHPAIQMRDLSAAVRDHRPRHRPGDVADVSAARIDEFRLDPRRRATLMLISIVL